MCFVLCAYMYKLYSYARVKDIIELSYRVIVLGTRVENLIKILVLLEIRSVRAFRLGKERIY